MHVENAFVQQRLEEIVERDPVLILADAAATMPSEVRKFSQECTHPSKKLCTKRTMTDIISEIETAASAHRACSADDSDILLTDFICAFSSVDHSLIFRVLQRADIPDGLRNFF